MIFQLGLRASISVINPIPAPWIKLNITRLKNGNKSVNKVTSVSVVQINITYSTCSKETEINAINK